MRALRLSLAGTVIFALLGGLGGAALAQEGTAIEPTGVVITAKQTAIGSDGVSTYEMPFYDIEGVVHSYEWEATDPRLSGEATYRGNWHDYRGPTWISLEAIEWAVENDDGSWAGPGHGIYSPEARYGDMAMWVMRGSGAYEGLTAFLTWDIADEGDTIRGVIVADGMPPFPDPSSD